ncbi:MAG: hypothetical protein ACM3ZT_09955 [Bacillota bacterium]
MASVRIVPRKPSLYQIMGELSKKTLAHNAEAVLQFTLAVEALGRWDLAASDAALAVCREQQEKSEKNRAAFAVCTKIAFAAAKKKKAASKPPKPKLSLAPGLPVSSHSWARLHGGYPGSTPKWL